MEEGRRVSDVARELGMSEGLLRRWKIKYEEGKEDPFPGNDRLSPEDEAFRQLKRENERLRMERDILKKQWPSSRRNLDEICFHTRPSRSIPSERSVSDSGSG